MPLFRKKSSQTTDDAAKETPKTSEQVVASKKSASDAPSMKQLYAEENLKKEVTTKNKDSRYTQSHRILVKPLITEKATQLGALNKYAFVVSSASNKLEVAKAIWTVYGVKPVQINIIKMKGKAVSRGRISGRRKDWKKAIITLKAGEQIKIYEGV